MSRLGYAFAQSIKQIGRNRAMTAASIFAITAMLLILGIFFIVIINVNTAAQSIKEDYNTIEIFLKDSTSGAATIKMENEIKTWQAIKSVKYRDKGEALSILKKRWGKNAYLLNNLSKNPLPNSIVISVNNLSYADSIAQKAKSLTGIEDVKYYKNTVDKLMKATDFIRLAAIIVMIFLIIISIVVVSNTIKLTVFNRSEEIGIMKCVGATNWFIRGPFLLEGIIIGAISAIISWGLITLIYGRVIAAIGDDVLSVLSLPLVPNGFLSYNLLWIFLALGISIGAWGSIISMRRFLDT